MLCCKHRDKEVSRLNTVIERLQEKTRAHVTAMNKELRSSNEKCAAQSERLAVMGERLRVAESRLATSKGPATEAQLSYEPIASEERAKQAMEELRLAETKAAALAAENDSLRSSLKQAAVFTPVRNPADDEPDDDLEGSPQAGELVV